MKLSRLTPTQDIEIYDPRWRDRVVLIATYKVGTHNQITFKTRSLPATYYLSGETIRACPIDSNGKIPCYAVPIDKLEVLERQ